MTSGAASDELRLDYGFAGAGCSCFERLAPICGPIIEPIVKHCPWLFRPRVVLVIVLLLMAIGLLVSETIFDGGAAVLYGFIGAVAAFMGVGLGVFHGTVAFCEDSDNTTRCCYFCRVPDCAKLCGANGDEREKCNTLFTDALLVAIVLGGLSSFVITAVQVQLDVNPLYITRDMFVWNALVFGGFLARNYIKTRDGWLDELQHASDGRLDNDWKALL